MALIKHLPTVYSAIRGKVDTIVFRLMEGETETQGRTTESEGGNKVVGKETANREKAMIWKLLETAFRRGQ